MLVEKYEHRLLFACPECDLPVTVSQISVEGNLETVQAQKSQNRMSLL